METACQIKKLAFIARDSLARDTCRDIAVKWKRFGIISQFHSDHDIVLRLLDKWSIGPVNPVFHVGGNGRFYMF